MWIFPACGVELTVVQVSNKNKLARGNLQMKVKCCVYSLTAAYLALGLSLSTWIKKTDFTAETAMQCGKADKG